MLRRTLISLLACVVLIGGAVSRAQLPQHRIVIAVTTGDEADWRLTVGNIRNLLTGLSKDTSTQIEVVAYGPGLSMVAKSSPVDQEIRDLQAKQVRFVACENSMRARHLTTADLLEGIGTVPSGIVEVVTKQEQGWAYIKAGR